MNALESPLEALAFDYLSYGVLTAVNNIWAWLAVITAAVSYWRIRASQSPKDRLISRIRDVIPSASASASSAPSELKEKTAEEADSVSAAPTKAPARVLERQGSTKLKFSLYYREESEGGESEESGGEAAEAAVEVSRKLAGRRCGDWERMMVVRKGDLGWYKWQDTTALDGSVVRLWEGCRRREAAAAAAVGGGCGW